MADDNILRIVPGAARVSLRPHERIYSPAEVKNIVADAVQFEESLAEATDADQSPEG